MRRKSPGLRQGALAATLFALAFCLPFRATAQTPADKWTFSGGLYLWGPTINSTLKYDIPPGAGGSPGAAGSFDLTVGPNDYLTQLNFALPIVFEARKGNWSIFTDVMYISLTGQRSSVVAINLTERIPVATTVNVGTSTTLKQLEWTLVGGYTALKGRAGNLDVIAGLRYFGVKTSTDWNLSAAINDSDGDQVFAASGNVSKREDVWNAIIGVKGQARLGEKWFLPYWADVSAGSSLVTWQGIGGGGYSFGWLDLALVYRHLSYQQSNDRLLQKLSLSGPALYSVFHF